MGVIVVVRVGMAVVAMPGAPMIVSGVAMIVPVGVIAGFVIVVMVVDAAHPALVVSRVREIGPKRERILSQAFRVGVTPPGST